MIISGIDMIAKKAELPWAIAGNNQINITLEIKSVFELNMVETFVTNNPKLKLLNAINQLVIAFNIDSDSKGSVNRFLTTVFQNEDEFTNLTSLTFQEGFYDCVFTLSDVCSKLKTLRIGKMQKATFTIPDSCSNLETLDIIGSDFKSVFKAPSALPELTSLTLNFHASNTMTLPNSLPKLTNLAIAQMSSCHLFPAGSFPKLEILTIERLGHRDFNFNGDLNLSGSSFHAVKHLIIERVYQTGTITLTGSLDNLTTIDIKNMMYSGGSARIPKLVKNIINPGGVGVATTLALPGTYKNLKKLSICGADFSEQLKSIQEHSQIALGSDLGFIEDREHDQDNVGTGLQKDEARSSSLDPVNDEEELSNDQDNVEEDQDSVEENDLQEADALTLSLVPVELVSVENDEPDFTTICRLWPHACLLFLSILIYMLWNKEQGSI